MTTLGDEFPKELQRNRELLKVYQSLGPVGTFGAAFISQDIATAEKALAEGDTVAMIRIYQKLKENQ